MKEKKIISVHKIDTKLQLADVLTKPLPDPEHAALSAWLLGAPLVFSKY
jgi:hypothetical protein